MKNWFDESEGNILIDKFMSGRKLEDFSDAYSTYAYHESWDMLMSVISKIKEKVFDEGYDMFMPEHHSYISIGNACYDADLVGAWSAVIRWILIRDEIISKEAIMSYSSQRRPSDGSGVCYVSKSHHSVSFFRVTVHCVRRWKQRFNENVTVDDILAKANNQKLIDAYKKSGNGEYFLENNTAVVIDNHKILTIYEKIIPSGKAYQKISDLKPVANYSVLSSQLDLLRAVREKTSLK